MFFFFLSWLVGVGWGYTVYIHSIQYGRVGRVGVGVGVAVGVGVQDLALGSQQFCSGSQ